MKYICTTEDIIDYLSRLIAQKHEAFPHFSDRELELTENIILQFTLGKMRASLKPSISREGYYQRLTQFSPDQLFDCLVRCQYFGCSLLVFLEKYCE